MLTPTADSGEGWVSDQKYTEVRDDSDIQDIVILETIETRGVGIALRGQRYCTQAGADRGGGHKHLQDVITS